MTSPLISKLQTHPCPVAEGQHQWDQPGFQFSQSSQVIGGETSHVITCTHFTHQAAAQTEEERATASISTHPHRDNRNQHSPANIPAEYSGNFGMKIGLDLRKFSYGRKRGKSEQREDDLKGTDIIEPQS